MTGVQRNSTGDSGKSRGQLKQEAINIPGSMRTSGRKGCHRGPKPGLPVDAETVVRWPSGSWDYKRGAVRQKHSHYCDAKSRDEE